MMSNPPGYPLPSGELGDDDIVCQLVYLPDKPEYWQALLGALSYMATWKAWERDNDKRGKDAASNWREAFELTMECWRMTCLDDLKDDVAAILAIMQIPQACCDPGDVTDGDQYTDRVEDGVGNVPQNIVDAGYASSTSDWDGFDDYKCMIAHVIVDQLVARLNEIAPLVDTAGGILGGVAALAGVLAVIFGTGGLAIVFGIVAGIGATSLLYQAITDFGLVESLATKVTTNHDDLVCAVYRADGDEDALSALNDEIDELFTVAEALILKNMNLGPTLKALYAGRYDQQDIADILDTAGYDTADFTCDCDQVGEYLDYTDFEPMALQSWSNSGGSLIDGTGVGGSDAWRGTYPNHHYIRMTMINLVFKEGINSSAGDYIDIHRITFWRNNTSTRLNYLILDIEASPTPWDYSHSPMVTSYELVEHIFSTPLRVYHGDIVAEFSCHGSFSDNVFLDNITIDYDYTEV